MKRLLVALLLGAAATVGSPTPPQAQAAEHAAYNWCYYGSYHCYDTACCKARYLRECGYCTRIIGTGSCYRVYYSH